MVWTFVVTVSGGHAVLPLALVSREAVFVPMCVPSLAGFIGKHGYLKAGGESGESSR